jgi:starch synthase
MTPTAAVFYNPDSYDTEGVPLVGRLVAGEEFLRALVRHAGFDRLTAVVRVPAHGEAFLRRLTHLGTTVPAGWIPHEDPASVEGVGSLFLSGPSLAPLAWQRRRHRQAAYSLCGVTHTICTDRAMEAIGALLVAPVQPWDALVCTSHAGRKVVLGLLEEQAAYLKERLGAARVERPQLPVIPLGVDTAAFDPWPGARVAWRARLGITEDDVAALMLGRLSHATKVSPLPMYLALGRAAAEAPPGVKVHLILAGRFESEAAERVFRTAAAALCPNVALHVLDGQMPDLRVNAFAAADFFTLLVDNIQETFGLAPVEAMAAGLPVVVSDWDGFRDTVEDGMHGFRIPTLMATAGGDLASRYAAGADGYAAFGAGVAQFVAVDVPAAEAAYRALIADPQRRRVMGEAARAHARARYEWRVVIGEYLRLWDALAELRVGACGERAPPAQGREPVPLLPNPFAAFTAYPTRRILPDTRLALADGASPERLAELISVPGAVVRGDLLPTMPELRAALERLCAGGPAAAMDLAGLVPPARRARLLRGLVWMAKLDLIRRQD